MATAIQLNHLETAFNRNMLNRSNKCLVNVLAAVDLINHKGLNPRISAIKSLKYMPE